MLKKIEHLGIAVKNLEQAIPIYEKLLQTPCYKKETVASESVITAFFEIGESKIELLQATDENSSIAKFLEKNREGFHHIAFATDNIEAEIKRLEAEDFIMIHKEAKAGADGKMIAFLHPKSTLSLLVELCEG